MKFLGVVQNLWIALAVVVAIAGGLFSMIVGFCWLKAIYGEALY